MPSHKTSVFTNININSRCFAFQTLLQSWLNTTTFRVPWLHSYVTEPWPRHQFLSQATSQTSISLCSETVIKITESDASDWKVLAEQEVTSASEMTQIDQQKTGEREDVVVNDIRALTWFHATAEVMQLYNNIFIYCNWVVTRWQWLFYMYTKHEIGYY
jgi:hypothetical protein